MSEAGSLLVRAVVAGFVPSHGLPKLRNGSDYVPSFEGMGGRHDRSGGSRYDPGEDVCTRAVAAISLPRRRRIDE